MALGLFFPKNFTDFSGKSSFFSVKQPLIMFKCPDNKNDIFIGEQILLTQRKFDQERVAFLAR